MSRGNHEQFKIVNRMGPFCWCTLRRLFLKLTTVNQVEHYEDRLDPQFLHGTLPNCVRAKLFRHDLTEPEPEPKLEPTLIQLDAVLSRDKLALGSYKARRATSDKV